jgi:hypothetical protein
MQDALAELTLSQHKNASVSSIVSFYWFQTVADLFWKKIHRITCYKSFEVSRLKDEVAK